MEQLNLKIDEQAMLVLEIYKHPDELIPIVESLDLFGKDWFWYMN